MAEFGREGRGIQRFSDPRFSVSISIHEFVGPSAIGEAWSVAMHHCSSYSSHSAKFAHGHPKSPRIGVPSSGAVSGGNQPAEQGSGANPAFTRFVVVFFGIGICFRWLVFSRAGGTL